MEFPFCDRLPLPWFLTFALFLILYAFFWVISRRMNFICRGITQKEAYKIADCVEIPWGITQLFMSFVGLSLCICTILFHVHCCMQECSSSSPNLTARIFSCFITCELNKKKINKNFRTVAMFLYLIPHQVSPVTQDVSYFDVYFRIYT